MKKNLVKLSIIFFAAIFSCSYGYSGNLPKLGESVKPIDNIRNNEVNISNPVKAEPPLIEPLAPKNFSDAYSNIIIRQGKYSNYLKDMDQIIPLLESMKQLIEDKNNINIQLFCAKSNTINLYISDLIKKYENKPEKYYESYKQLTGINKSLVEIANYWQKSIKYKKIIRGSSNDRITDDKIIQKKLDSVLKSIITALDILKENSDK
ncbi:MAG: hypothetical protein PHC34_13075 [Candidatus Gastranaerophilales bacterium]|nr:hypothetical protein [Candidatus Gastranaerophilales bacterium]